MPNCCPPPGRPNINGHHPHWQRDGRWPGDKCRFSIQSLALHRSQMYFFGPHTELGCWGEMAGRETLGVGGVPNGGRWKHNLCDFFCITRAIFMEKMLNNRFKSSGELFWSWFLDVWTLGTPYLWILLYPNTSKHVRKYMEPSLNILFLHIWTFIFCQFWKRRAPKHDEDASNKISRNHGYGTNIDQQIWMHFCEYGTNIHYKT